MKVWLVTVGEPLPTDPGHARLLRVGIIASMLAARGYDTTWWTSRFDHHAKLMRSGLPASSTRVDGVKMELLDGAAYASNVSLARLRNHRQLAADFMRRAQEATAPDVILCSYPTIELCEAATQYGRERGIPVVLDIRDLWPDIFLNLAPAVLRPAARLALGGMFRASARACARADAIVGITEAFVDWGVARAGRARAALDRAFPLAYTAELPPSAAVQAAHLAWDRFGVTRDMATLCFFGTLGRQFDIPAVLRAAGLLREQPVRFVICGNGDRLEEYRRLAAGLPKVLMPGWVDAAAIRALMERSLAGLAPYHNERSFTLSLPNKAIEYLAGGLPVLSSLGGELARLLEREGCGFTYAEGDEHALAAAIVRLLDEPGWQAGMADNATRAYRSHFVAEEVYGRLIDHLLQVAQQRQAPAPSAEQEIAHP